MSKPFPSLANKVRVFSLITAICLFVAMVFLGFQIYKNKQIPKEKEAELYKKVQKFSNRVTKLQELHIKLDVEKLKQANEQDLLASFSDPIDTSKVESIRLFEQIEDSLRIDTLFKKSTALHAWPSNSILDRLTKCHTLISTEFSDSTGTWVYRIQRVIEEDKYLVIDCSEDLLRDMLNIEKMLSKEDRRTSHIYIASGDQEMVYHSNKTLSKSGVLNSLKTIAHNQNDAENNGSLKEFIRTVVIPQTPVCNVDTIVKYKDRTQSEESEWRVYAKINPSNWTYVLIYNTSQLNLRKHAFIRSLLFLFFLGGLFLVCVILFWRCQIRLVNFNGNHLITPKTNIFIQLFPKGARVRLKARKDFQFLIRYSTIVLSATWVVTLTVVYFNWAGLYEQNGALVNSKAFGNSAKIIHYAGATNYLKEKFKINDSVLQRLGGVLAKSEDELIYNVLQISLEINQIDLISSNKVNASGKIMVRYPKRMWPKDSTLKLTPQLIEPYKDPPFYFSNAVDIGTIEHLATHWDKTLRKQTGNMDDCLVSTYHFSVCLHQTVEHKNYPFDVLPLQIHIQPRQANQEIIIPDFDHYFEHAKQLLDYEDLSRTEAANNKQARRDSSTAYQDAQVLLRSHDDHLAINEWTIINGFFTLGKAGFLQNLNQGTNLTTPELVHTTIIQRKLIQPLIANFLPITVIALIIYIMVLKMHKIDIGSFIATIVGLFFSLLLSHYQVRSDLHINSVVFVEWFYFLLYVILLVVMFNKYCHAASKPFPLFDYRDNFIAKASYWPLFFLFSTVITIVFFGKDLVNWEFAKSLMKWYHFLILALIVTFVLSPVYFLTGKS